MVSQVYISPIVAFTTSFLREVIFYLPLAVARGHIKLAERFVDPAFSFIFGMELVV
jgi:amino acid permease